MNKPPVNSGYPIPAKPESEHTSTMRLSIVTSLYQSAPYINTFYTEIRRYAEQITPDYEIIFVNDGSPDNALYLAQDLYETDPLHVCVIDLSRNFGHHKALMTGIAHATGDLILLIDSDLEEPPELLAKFYAVYQQNPAADVVYGQASNRDGSLLRRIAGGLYYRLLRRLTGLDIPRDLLMTRLMSRRYARHLVKHSERRYSIEGLWELTGYQQIPVAVDKKYKGETTYTFRRRLTLAIDGITSLSNKPLIYIAYLGITISLASILYILYALFMYAFGGSNQVAGWTTIVASVWLLGGVQIFVIGIIGIYLSVIFQETKQRPYTIIREIQRHPEHPPELNPSLVENPEPAFNPKEQS